MNLQLQPLQPTLAASSSERVGSPDLEHKQDETSPKKFIPSPPFYPLVPTAFDEPNADANVYFCLTERIEPKPIKKTFNIYDALNWALFVTLLIIGVAVIAQTENWDWQGGFGSLFFLGER